MTISVIIATRDRASLLASTLEALGRQDCDASFEIIIADNGSTDATPRVVESAARDGLPVVYVQEQKPGKSHALNTAVPHASGELLVFTDDDVLPSPGWLRAYADAFRDPAVDFAAGRIEPLWEAPPPAWMSPRLYGVLAVADGGLARLDITDAAAGEVMPLGANMAIRRHVLDRIGGWNTDLGKLQGTLRTGEDHDFFVRMILAGCKGIYEPAASVRHRVPPERLRLRYFLRWFYDNGAVEAQMEQLYPTTDRYVLTVPRYLWRQAVGDVGALLRGVLTLDRKRMVASGTRVAWFFGYLRYRWSDGRRRAVARVAAQTVPLSRV